MIEQAGRRMITDEERWILRGFLARHAYQRVADLKELSDKELLSLFMGTERVLQLEVQLGRPPTGEELLAAVAGARGA